MNGSRRDRHRSKRDCHGFRRGRFENYQQKVTPMEQNGSKCENEGIATGANGNVIRAKVIAMIAKEIALIADKRLQLKVKNWYNSENLTSHPVCSTAIRLSSLLSSQQLSNYYTRRWEKGGHEVHTMRQGHSLVPN